MCVSASAGARVLSSASFFLPQPQSVMPRHGTYKRVSRRVFGRFWVCGMELGEVHRSPRSPSGDCHRCAGTPMRAHVTTLGSVTGVMVWPCGPMYILGELSRVWWYGHVDPCDTSPARQKNKRPEGSGEGVGLWICNHMCMHTHVHAWKRETRIAHSSRSQGQTLGNTVNVDV
jgi:hypothetical protein